MAAINITGVQVLNNPSSFLDSLQFDISYECLFDLPHDLEWKITYVGSAEDEQYDQVLDSVLVGPVTQGSYRFVFQAEPPQADKIRAEDLLGVTVVLLTCSYNGNEFIRVGYYVNNDYKDEEMKLNPPAIPQLHLIERNVLSDKPRVTRFQIEWDSSEPENVHPAHTDNVPAAGAADCGAMDTYVQQQHAAVAGDDMTMG